MVFMQIESDPHRLLSIVSLTRSQRIQRRPPQNITCAYGDLPKMLAWNHRENGSPLHDVKHQVYNFSIFIYTLHITEEINHEANARGVLQMLHKNKFVDYFLDLAP